MNSTHPIFLLVNGEVSEPLEYDEVVGKLDSGELKPETFACVEGMREWRSVPEVCVWSAGRLLLPILAKVKAVVRRLSENDLSLPHARLEIMDLLGRGTVINGERLERLGLILEVNELLLRNHGFRSACEQDWDPDTIDSWPAWELIPTYGQEPKFPRDWHTAWQAAGGQLFDGRMIARKDSQVWEALSDFGFPFPPFSLDISMSVSDLDADEASELAVVDGRQKIKLPRSIKPFGLVGIL